MKTGLQTVFKLVLGLLLMASLDSCAPPKVQDKNKIAVSDLELTKPELPAEPLDYELVPTEQLPITSKSSEIRYEKPQTEIRTEQTVLHLNQVKMSEVALTYDVEKHSLAIKGTAEIFDDNQRLLAENSFAVVGISQNNDLVITLNASTKEKINSNLKPVVRAQATCLATNKNNEPDCSRVVIDFYIAYKQKIYTEQMEIKPVEKKVAPQLVPPAPVIDTGIPRQTEVIDPTISTDATATTDATPEPSETSELQKEDSEISSPGRFQGQAEAVDLTKIFDHDDEIQKVIKPKQVQAPEPKINPVKDQKAPQKEDKGKSITSDVAETKSGELRPQNQAMGFPDKGSLHNATSLLVTQKKLAEKSFFDIAFPDKQRYFATYEMAEMLTRMGERLHLQFNKNLAISDISKMNGGLLSPHLSHQIGMDADIAYPSANNNTKFPVVVEMRTRRFNPNLFSVAKTFDLLKFAFQQQDLKIDRIFIDRSIKASLCEYAKAKGELTGPDKTLVQKLFKSIEHINGHGDHFHLRLSCTPAHPGCRKKNYIEVAGCQ